MEASTAEQQGFVGLTGVRERYGVAEDGLVLGAGGIDRWYTPIAHRELPEVVATLREASEAEIVRFARTYGGMGYESIVRDPEKATHRRADGTREAGGDPVWWLRGHGWSAHMCLEISDAVERKDARLATEVLHNAGQLERGIMQGAERVHVTLIGQQRDDSSPFVIDAPLEQARDLRRQIINANIADVSRAIYPLTGGAGAVLFQVSGGNQGRILAPGQPGRWWSRETVRGGRVRRRLHSDARPPAILPPSVAPERERLCRARTSAQATQSLIRVSLWDIFSRIPRPKG